MEGKSTVYSGGMPKYISQGSDGRPCSIDGCPGRHAARGYCLRHYCRIVRRKSGIVDAPGDNNPASGEPMTEDEFCRFKDCRAQGFSELDVAFELEKNVTVIKAAWEYECFAEYERGPDRSWPSIRNGDGEDEEAV